ncbi:hypothetical protein [Dorea formicigenerans]|nr:hypothetical protein [Dorea formicigenerans]
MKKTVVVLAEKPDMANVHYALQNVGLLLTIRYDYRTSPNNN